MANGYCPYFLAHLKTIAQCNAPSSKITPTGFFRSLVENRPTIEIINPVSSLRLDDGAGHIKDLQLKYRERSVPEQTSTYDNCDIDVRPSYKEMTVATTNYRKLSVYLDDETLAHYCEDATEMQRTAGMPTPLMKDFMDMVMENANALIGAIDKDLLTLQLTKFGTNVVTHSNAATSINIPQSTVINDLDSGITKLLQHASENEVCGNLILAGNGLMNNYFLQLRAAGLAATGIDNSKFQDFKWYNDIYSTNIWGANHIIGYSAGSVGFIELNRYMGWRSGKKGNSEFFTMPLPIECPECYGDYDSVDFDIQLRYVDCPTEVLVAGVLTTIPRGWVMDIGKSFGLFNIPGDAYQGTGYGDAYNDRLIGNNGTLRFVISNT
jgi:hypothetical protein